jgi:DNA-binding LytR/AlgR family response regulator
MTRSVLRAVIADDDPWARARLRDLLDACGVRTLAECGTGRDALAAVARARPDAIWLDVRMPDLDGLEVARRLHVRPRPAVVFTTGYPDYALAAFDVGAVDYLTKPLAAARVEEAIRRIFARRPAAETVTAAPRVFIPNGDHHLALGPQAIRYIVAERRCCVVCADDGLHRVRARLDRLEAMLAPHGFLRTHRAYLVNLNRVRALVPWSRHVASLLLDGPGEPHIPVAKSRVAAFRRGVIWIAAARGRLARSPEP